MVTKKRAQKKTAPAARKKKVAARKVKKKKAGSPKKKAAAVKKKNPSRVKSPAKKVSRKTGPKAAKKTAKNTAIKNAKKVVAKSSPKKKAVKGALPASVLQKILDILLQKQAKLAGNVSRLEDGAFWQSGLTVSVDNMADYGTDSYEQEFNLGLVESHEMTLAEINEAIVRIRSGKYGLCEDCSAVIPKARLQAIPYTRVCVNCQAKREGS